MSLPSTTQGASGSGVNSENDISNVNTSSSSLSLMNEIAESSTSTLSIITAGSSLSSSSLGLGVGVGLASFSSSNTPFSTLNTSTSTNSLSSLNPNSTQMPTRNLILGTNAASNNINNLRAQSNINNCMRATTSSLSNCNSHHNFNGAATNFTLQNNHLGNNVTAQLSQNFNYLHATPSEASSSIANLSLSGSSGLSSASHQIQSYSPVTASSPTSSPQANFLINNFSNESMVSANGVNRTIFIKFFSDRYKLNNKI